MLLHMNGMPIIAEPGDSLISLAVKLGLSGSSLSERPIAAKIAGEIFNLNYVPVRDKDTGHERTSIRRAMAASNGEVRLLYYDDPAGRDVYGRTVQFVLFLALNQLWPKVRAKMNTTLGPALFVEVRGEPDFSVSRLKEKVQELVAMDFPLTRKRVSTLDAIEYYRSRGCEDKAKLLSLREKVYFDQYVYGDFADYYYGELAPSSGYLQVWDIQEMEDGFLFLYPSDTDPNHVAIYEDMPKLRSVSTEGERWCELMECETVADLNGLVQSGRIRELIRVNEALHEKRYAQIADTICKRDAKIVLLSGPSSSGKTTSANRLATQLRVQGKKPILMSLDDYYLNRDQIPPEPDGKLDLEHIRTIDTDLLRQHLRQLLNGSVVEIPSFDFVTGKRYWRGHSVCLDAETVIIAEGLHALNPILIPEDLDPDSIFRMYVCPLLPLNLDDHNRIPSSLLRLLRRTVRDYETRDASVERTMSMWDSVRRGEKKWIFPYQENADVIFNSSTLYELAVLKKHIFPLLTEVTPEESCYDDVRGIVKILNYVLEADVDDEIPPTSLVREFIGGNSFYK